MDFVHYNFVVNDFLIVLYSPQGPLAILFAYVYDLFKTSWDILIFLLQPPVFLSPPWFYWQFDFIP